jgi:RNA polymerase sigma-70 factor (ECF subfamily)
MTSRYLRIYASDNRNDAGNRQRVIELYEVVRPTLHAYLRSLGLSDHSEDIIQETFLRLVRYTAERGANENLRAWVFRVAHNLSMDYHRSERRCFRSHETQPSPVLRDRIDPGPNPEQKIILDERLREFEDAFAQLTPRQRDCLLLRAEGLRYREIAVELGVSVQRVGELMQRAISILDVFA